MLCWLHVYGGQTCGRAASRFAVSVKCASAQKTVRSNLLDSCSRSLRLPGVLAVVQIDFMTNLPLCGGEECNHDLH